MPETPKVEKPKSLRELILSYDDEVREPLVVPQWGNLKIEIRSMSGAERSRFLTETRKPGSDDADLNKFYPMIVVLTAYDPETGERIFGDNDMEDLNLKSSGALELVASAALRLNGISAGSVDAAGNASSPSPG